MTTDVSSHGFKTGSDRSSESTEHCAIHDANAGVQFHLITDHAFCVVGTVVVDNDDFVRNLMFIPNGFAQLRQTQTDVLLFVIRGNDN